MKNKIKFILFLLFIFLFSIAKINSQNFDTDGIILLPGSNVYARIFLFYFPISKKHETYLTIQKNTFILEILIKKDQFILEPFTPSYFETELLFSIKNISFKKNGRYRLPISIRVNQKFIEKKAEVSIYFKENILIINGALNDLFIKDITDNQFFKKRYNWRYPIYFDIRIQLGDDLLESLNEIFKK